MKIKTKQRPLASLIPLLLSGMSLSAMAQEVETATTDNELKFEVIQVTAQRRVQNLQEVPIAISAISGEKIANEAISDIFDIQDNTPGLIVFQGASSITPQISIRGVGTSSQNFGLESSVGLYVDGVYRARQSAMVNEYVDVDAVEILRGPQGTLFGKNTPMGAIHVRSVAPSHDDANGFLKLTVGNLGLISYSGATNVTAVEDTLSFRFTGSATQRDGSIDDLNFGDNTVNDRDRYTVKLQALYTPSEDVSLRIIADYGELDEICCGANPIVSNFEASGIPGRFGTDTAISQPPFNSNVIRAENFNDRVVATSFLPSSQMEDSGLSAELNWDINEQFTLTSISSYRDFSSDDRVDGDFAEIDFLDNNNNAEQRSLSQELRLAYSSDDLNIVGGVFYFNQEIDTLSYNKIDSDLNSFALNVLLRGALNPLLGGINQLSANTGGLIAPAALAGPEGTKFINAAAQEHESYAIFGQFDYKLTEKLTLTAGLRYTDESKDLKSKFTEEFTNGGDNPTFFSSVGNPAIPQSIVPGTLLFGAAAAGQALQLISTGVITPGTPQFGQAIQTFIPFQSQGWIFNALSPVTASRPDISAELNDEQVNGTLKLSYQANPKTLLYASFGTGYKSGGTNTDRIATAFDPVFDAETSEAFEIGIKKDFPKYGLRLNAAAHATTVNDFQANSFVGNGFNLQNAGDFDIKGVEVEANWMLSANTTLNLAFTHTEAEYASFDKGPCWTVTPFQTGQADPGQESTNPAVPNPFCNRAGDSPISQPENTGLLQLSHEFELGDSTYAVAAIDYNYVGEFFATSSNDPLSHIDSQGFVNARINITFEDYDTSVLIWGRNITDAQQVGLSAPPILQQGKLVGFYADPATFGVTVIKKF